LKRWYCALIKLTDYTNRTNLTQKARETIALKRLLLLLMAMLRSSVNTDFIEDDGRPTQLRTHISRHNINTFLAIAEISDYLQAMLMGRVDITQNKHYQHLALKERRKTASLIPLVQIL